MDTISPGGRPWTAAVALVTATLSSACCWVPLVAAALGTSFAGLAAWLEAARVPLLALTGLALAASFYAVYGRGMRSRRNRIAVWSALACALALAFAPMAAAAWSDEDGAAMDGSLMTGRFDVEGMTCEGCEVGIREALLRIDGVAAAEVSFAEGAAEVRFSAPADDQQIMASITALGYSVNRADPVAPSLGVPTCTAGQRLVHELIGEGDPGAVAVCEACASDVDASAPITDQPDAPDGAVVRCPVSRVPIVVDSARPRVEYAGSVYRFCCASCARHFLAHPERFVRTRCL